MGIVIISLPTHYSFLPYPCDSRSFIHASSTSATSPDVGISLAFSYLCSRHLHTHSIVKYPRGPPGRTSIDILVLDHRIELFLLQTLIASLRLCLIDHALPILAFLNFSYLIGRNTEVQVESAAGFFGFATAAGVRSRDGSAHLCAWSFCFWWIGWDELNG